MIESLLHETRLVTLNSVPHVIALIGTVRDEMVRAAKSGPISDRELLKELEIDTPEGLEDVGGVNQDSVHFPDSGFRTETSPGGRRRFKLALAQLIGEFDLPLALRHFEIKLGWGHATVITYARWFKIYDNPEVIRRAYTHEFPPKSVNESKARSIYNQIMSVLDINSWDDISNEKRDSLPDSIEKLAMILGTISVAYLRKVVSYLKSDYRPKRNYRGYGLESSSVPASVIPSWAFTKTKSWESYISAVVKEEQVKRLLTEIRPRASNRRRSHYVEKKENRNRQKEPTKKELILNYMQSLWINGVLHDNQPAIFWDSYIRELGVGRTELYNRVKEFIELNGLPSDFFRPRNKVESA